MAVSPTDIRPVADSPPTHLGSQAEGQMEIHRPKPWHGVREFLKEIAIVVLGVLIAIGAEQIVEALSWRQRVEAGRQSLEPDLSEILWNVGEEEAEEKCVRDRLSFIRQAVLADRRSTPGIGQIGNPPSRGWYPSSWDSLVAANISAHMPRAELVRFADIAVRARYLEQTQDAALADWARIYAVLGPRRDLETGELAQALAAIADAQFRQNEMAVIAPELGQEVKATGLLSAADLQRVRAEVAWTLRRPNARRLCGPPQPAQPGVVDAPNSLG